MTPFDTTPATPAVKYINDIPYVRVIDLARQWDTVTSNVLAIGKPHHVPEEYLRRIDGRIWCSFPGLRYRLTATHASSRLTRHIREFLDAQAAKKPLEPEPEPTASASQTLAQKNKKRIDKLEQETRAQHETLIERVRLTELRQQDDRARIVALEEKARAIDWTMTAIAMLSVAARLIRLLRRR